MLKNVSFIASEAFPAAAWSKMYYPQELPRPRPRPPLYESNHISKTKFLNAAQQQPTRYNRRCCRPSKFLGPIVTYLAEYCASSSVHGFRYLMDPQLRNFEKCIWFLIMLGTSICATIVYVDLNELYKSVRTQTTIENTMQPVFYIHFPSVGLCPRNRINWLTLQNEAPEHFLGHNLTSEQRELFIRFFSAASDVHIDDMQSLGKFFENATLEANVIDLNELDVSKVLEFIQLKCNDLFMECKWRGLWRDCCKYFELQRTELGFCWVFNSAVSQEMQEREKLDKFYPRRTANAGAGTGLDVWLRLNKTLAGPGIRGVYVMIKQPQQWSDSARLLPYDSYNRVSLTPRYTASDDATRVVAALQRHCIFPDEVLDPHYKNLPGFVYWRGNCRTRCHQEYVLNLCKCSPSLLFPVSKEDNFTDCKVSDFKCLYEHRATFSEEHLPVEQEYVGDVKNFGMICDCLNSCSQLVYDATHSNTAMTESQLNPDLMIMHLDVYFHSPWFVKYWLHMRFTFVELLANFGGIIGLFLGASLLSAIEIVYYFTIGLYLYIYRDNRKLKQQHPQTPPILIHFRPKIAPTKVLS